MFLGLARVEVVVVLVVGAVVAGASATVWRGFGGGGTLPLAAPSPLLPILMSIAAGRVKNSTAMRAFLCFKASRSRSETLGPRLW